MINRVEGKDREDQWSSLEKSWFEALKDSIPPHLVQSALEGGKTPFVFNLKNRVALVKGLLAHRQVDAVFQQVFVGKEADSLQHLLAEKAAIDALTSEQQNTLILYLLDKWDDPKEAQSFRQILKSLLLDPRFEASLKDSKIAAIFSCGWFDGMSLYAYFAKQRDSREQQTPLDFFRGHLQDRLSDGRSVGEALFSSTGNKMVFAEWASKDPNDLMSIQHLVLEELRFLISRCKSSNEPAYGKALHVFAKTFASEELVDTFVKIKPFDTDGKRQFLQWVIQDAGTKEKFEKVLFADEIFWGKLKGFDHRALLEKGLVLDYLKKLIDAQDVKGIEKFWHMKTPRHKGGISSVNDDFQQELYETEKFLQALFPQIGSLAKEEREFLLPFRFAKQVVGWFAYLGKTHEFELSDFVFALLSAKVDAFHSFLLYTKDPSKLLKDHYVPCTTKENKLDYLLMMIQPVGFRASDIAFYQAICSELIEQDDAFRLKSFFDFIGHDKLKLLETKERPFLNHALIHSKVRSVDVLLQISKPLDVSTSDPSTSLSPLQTFVSTLISTSALQDVKKAEIFSKILSDYDPVQLNKIFLGKVTKGKFHDKSFLDGILSSVQQKHNDEATESLFWLIPMLAERGVPIRSKVMPDPTGLRIEVYTPSHMTLFSYSLQSKNWWKFMIDFWASPSASKKIDPTLYMKSFYDSLDGGLSKHSERFLSRWITVLLQHPHLLTNAQLLESQKGQPSILKVILENGKLVKYAVPLIDRLSETLLAKEKEGSFAASLEEVSPFYELVRTENGSIVDHLREMAELLASFDRFVNQKLDELPVSEPAEVVPGISYEDIQPICTWLDFHAKESLDKLFNYMNSGEYLQGKSKEMAHAWLTNIIDALQKMQAEEKKKEAQKVLSLLAHAGTVCDPGKYIHLSQIYQLVKWPLESAYETKMWQNLENWRGVIADKMAQMENTRRGNNDIMDVHVLKEIYTLLGEELRLPNAAEMLLLNDENERPHAPEDVPKWKNHFRPIFYKNYTSQHNFLQLASSLEIARALGDDLWDDYLIYRSTHIPADFKGRWLKENRVLVDEIRASANQGAHKLQETLKKDGVLLSLPLWSETMSDRQITKTSLERGIAELKRALANADQDAAALSSLFDTLREDRRLDQNLLKSLKQSVEDLSPLLEQLRVELAPEELPLKAEEGIHQIMLLAYQNLIEEIDQEARTLWYQQADAITNIDPAFKKEWEIEKKERIERLYREAGDDPVAIQKVEQKLHQELLAAYRNIVKGRFREQLDWQQFMTTLHQMGIFKSR